MNKDDKRFEDLCKARDILKGSCSQFIILIEDGAHARKGTISELLGLLHIQRIDLEYEARRDVTKHKQEVEEDSKEKEKNNLEQKR